MQLAQSTGGSPYDEDAYMRIPVTRSGGNALMGGGGGQGNGANINDFLNGRLRGRVSPAMGDYMVEGMTPQPTPQGGDMGMMMTYGPPDQVVIDQQGRPIPLNDPRHSRNQNNYGMPSAPNQQVDPRSVGRALLNGR